MAMFGEQADPRLGGGAGQPSSTPPTRRTTSPTSPRPPTPSAPSTPGSTVSTGDPTTSSVTVDPAVVAGLTTDMDQLRRRQLRAAMQSIDATFGGNISQQEALLAELDPRFDIYEQQQLRDRRFAIEGAQDSMVDRGIYQSGITGRSINRAMTPYTEAIAAAEATRGQQEQVYLSQIEQLRAQQAAKEKEARLASQRDQLDFELYLASVGT